MTIAIVQARMNSRRLPGKVLRAIAGQPMLWHVVQRLRQARRIQRVVVATSVEPADDPVADFCAARQIACFRGSEADVLDRYYQAACHFAADNIVRVSADCPLIDPQIVDEVIVAFEQGDTDYVTNTLHCTYPDGLDVEVFSFAALEKTWQEATAPVEREHVTEYLRTSGKFRLANVANKIDLGREEHRWTVDDERDLIFVTEIFQALGQSDNNLFHMQDVLNLLQQRPDLRQIHKEIIRNEGYYVSLLQEKNEMSIPARSLEKSKELLARARRVIPSQTQTFSKGPTQFVQCVSPSFLQRGQGSHVWDVDGNEYIDYILALGPIILGYDYPAVTEAVVRQIHDGVSFSLPHRLEVELAEVLTKIIPCAEMVRFGKNGSDATAGAVRAARAYTGREKIACCGYHGWQDWYIGTTTRRRGVPRSTQELTLPFNYNDPDSLERLFAQHFGEIAAVIMEPFNIVEPVDNFLAKVADITRRHGALLIFDEVVTGFRIALAGAQEYFGVVPDLACFGKAMANGFPLAAVVGKREIMEIFDEIFFSFTFGGEAVSLAAAQAVIDVMQTQPVIDHLWEQGRKLKDGYNVMARELGVADVTRCIGLPPRPTMTFSDVDEAGGLVARSLVEQELVKRGILLLSGCNLSFSHSDADVEHTLRAFRVALETLAQAMRSGNPRSFLDDAPVQAIFRKVA